ncbi:hypothetical protein SVIOM342S_10057 [Streptomyces violaceorubidus]
MERPGSWCGIHSRMAAFPGPRRKPSRVGLTPLSGAVKASWSRTIIRSMKRSLPLFLDEFGNMLPGEDRWSPVLPLDCRRTSAANCQGICVCHSIDLRIRAQPTLQAGSYCVPFCGCRSIRAPNVTVRLLMVKDSKGRYGFPQGGTCGFPYGEPAESNGQHDGLPRIPPTAGGSSVLLVENPTGFQGRTCSNGRKQGAKEAGNGTDCAMERHEPLVRHRPVGRLRRRVPRSGRSGRYELDQRRGVGGPRVGPRRQDRSLR